MQKFMRTGDTAVSDYLHGLARAHPDLIRYDPERGIVVRAEAGAPKVAIVSGGGSGCEPLHTGFVGEGMLDAACPGSVFSSPVPRQIVAATQTVDQGHGVLYVVTNYGGEIMNFGLAGEILGREGHEIEKVVVDDDVALDGDLRHLRRGMGATVLVEKLAGAAAESGAPLDEVAAVARRTVQRSRTFAVALGPCVHPSTGSPAFELPAGQMEVGVGLGGDRGLSREPLPPADAVAEALVERAVAELSISDGARVIVLLSGLGGTPELELVGLFGHVHTALERRGAAVERSLVGNYVTSLESPGAQLTVLHTDDELTRYWDAPVRTRALRWGAPA